MTLKYVWQDASTTALQQNFNMGFVCWIKILCFLLDWFIEKGQFTKFNSNHLARPNSNPQSLVHGYMCNVCFPPWNPLGINPPSFWYPPNTLNKPPEERIFDRKRRKIFPSMIFAINSWERFVCVCDCNLVLNNHREFCNLGFWVLLVFIRRKKKKKTTQFYKNFSLFFFMT